MRTRVENAERLVNLVTDNKKMADGMKRQAANHMARLGDVKYEAKQFFEAEHELMMRCIGEANKVLFTELVAGDDIMSDEELDKMVDIMDTDLGKKWSALRQHVAEAMNRHLLAFSVMVGNRFLQLQFTRLQRLLYGVLATFAPEMPQDKMEHFVNTLLLRNPIVPSSDEHYQGAAEHKQRHYQEAMSAGPEMKKVVNDRGANDPRQVLLDMLRSKGLKVVDITDEVRKHVTDGLQPEGKPT